MTLCPQKSTNVNNNNIYQSYLVHFSLQIPPLTPPPSHPPTKKKLKKAPEKKFLIFLEMELSSYNIKKIRHIFLYFFAFLEMELTCPNITKILQKFLKKNSYISSKEIFSYSFPIESYKKTPIFLAQASKIYLDKRFLCLRKRKQPKKFISNFLYQRFLHENCFPSEFFPEFLHHNFLPHQNFSSFEFFSVRISSSGFSSAESEEISISSIIYFNFFSLITYLHSSKNT